MQSSKTGPDLFNTQDTGTGSHALAESYRFVIYPFGKYEIKVVLNSSDEFLGITEISINKDFLTHKQKMSIKGYHDVDEFYPE